MSHNNLTNQNCAPLQNKFKLAQPEKKTPSDWDLTPKCVCGPKFISCLIRQSPICRPLVYNGGSWWLSECRDYPRTPILCDHGVKSWKPSIPRWIWAGNYPDSGVCNVSVTEVLAGNCLGVVRVPLSFFLSYFVWRWSKELKTLHVTVDLDYTQVVNTRLSRSQETVPDRCRPIRQ